MFKVSKTFVGGFDANRQTEEDSGRRVSAWFDMDFKRVAVPGFGRSVEMVESDSGDMSDPSIVSGEFDEESGVTVFRRTKRYISFCPG